MVVETFPPTTFPFEPSFSLLIISANEPVDPGGRYGAEAAFFVSALASLSAFDAASDLFGERGRSG